MTDEQIRQDAKDREAADRADNARHTTMMWIAAENAANRAHQHAMQAAEAAHCEAMARITVDSSSGSGHPLGVVGRGLEALGITPGDVGALLRKRVDPETPFDRFDRIFGAVVEAVTPIAVAYAAKMNAAPADDRPSMRAVISGKNAIPAMLGALAALGYGGAGGDAEDAEDEFAEHVGKPRAEWGQEETAAMFQVLMEWLEPDDEDTEPADPVDDVPRETAFTDAERAECADRIKAGESAADVVDDIVKWVNARHPHDDADLDNADGVE